jgi:HK97 family phage major capsid protein
MSELNRKTGDFGSSGEFLVSTRRYFNGDGSDSRIVALQKAAQAEGIDSAGGVLVPEEYAAEVYEVALEGAIVRPRATVLPILRETLNIPRLIDSDRSSNIFGGITASWQEEGAELFSAASSPKLGNLKLSHKKLVMTAIVSNELENDAYNFGAFFSQSFGTALRFLEDDAFIWGTGGGQPLGVMSSGALITATRAANGKIDMADLAGMAVRLTPDSWNRAVWIVNQSVLSEWMTLNDAAQYGAAYIDLATMTCLDRPIIVSEHAAAAFTSGDIILADFSQYVIAGQDMTIASSRDATYSSNSAGWFQGQSLWRVTLHVDGQPIPSAAITPKRGGSTVSPFVALTTTS